MSLDRENDLAAKPADEGPGSRFHSHPAPKDGFPVKGLDRAAAYQLVHDELLLDGNSRQNLATFCQTWVEPEITQLMHECLGKNLVDKDEYPQMAELEARCVHMLADLWHSPDAANTIGCSTTLTWSFVKSLAKTAG